MLPLELKHITKSYSSLTAVNDLSLTIEPGEIFGLLGPNGAGKTTTISMITTLEQPDSGSIHVFGKDLATDPQGCKQLFGVVPQENMSHGFFTLKEILDFHAGYFGIQPDPKWLSHVMDKLDLHPHKHKLVRQLSGGMKKRLMIAKSLVHRPKLVLLDEPTAGVDLELRDILYDFIKDLKRDGTTILLTTHYLQEAELLCDRVGIIDQGQIKRMGKTEQLITDLTTRDITLSLSSAPQKESQYYVDVVDNRYRYRMPVDLPFHALVEELQIPICDILDVSIREGTLEDAVRRIIRKEPPVEQS